MTGVHPETIGLRLDRSANAVRAKARRLGLPKPARATLRKLDPACLQDPIPGLGLEADHSTGPVSACGRAAGAISTRPEPRTNDTKPDAQRQEISNQANPRIFAQQEIPFAQATASTSSSPSETRIAPPIPKTEADIDLSGDLTWIATLKKPRANRLAVWVIGLLIFGGLHYKDAAARIGKTPASFRTLRTRCGVPVDFDRSKISPTFDADVARQTCAESNYILKRCHTSGHWFWEHRRNRGCNASPTIRRKSAFRDTLIEGRSPTFTLRPRQKQLPMPLAAFLPFAESPSTMHVP